MRATVWDHYPTDDELAELCIDPEDHKDQDGHLFEPMNWPRVGARTPAICTCCEQNFLEGGHVGLAKHDAGVVRILVCDDHLLSRTMMEEESELEPLSI